jgi:Recombinase
MPTVRHTDEVRRLTYTRREAAQALGMSVRTLDRRVVPAIATIKTEWGSRLIPASELERYLAERMQPPTMLFAPSRRRGRPLSVPDSVILQIRSEFESGKSLGQIARDLNASGVRTAHGGRRWWSSTVRSILVRSTT